MGAETKRSGTPVSATCVCYYYYVLLLLLLIICDSLETLKALKHESWYWRSVCLGGENAMKVPRTFIKTRTQSPSNSPLKGFCCKKHRTLKILSSSDVENPGMFCWTRQQCLGPKQLLGLFPVFPWQLCWKFRRFQLLGSIDSGILSVSDAQFIELVFLE